MDRFTPRWTKRWSAPRKRRSDDAHGQTGLFGLFDEAPAHGHNGDDLPHVADWEEGERLANEKEVLGFFVSGHPLDKYAEKMRNLPGVIPISEALERKPPERRWGKENDPADEIQVAGIIQGCACRRASATGSSTPRRALEDATGKIDLICFPASTSALRSSSRSKPRY